jgi:hypothetical protein
MNTSSGRVQTHVLAIVGFTFLFASCGSSSGDLAMPTVSVAAPGGPVDAELPGGAVECEGLAPPLGTGAAPPTGTRAEFDAAKEMLLGVFQDSDVWTGLGNGGTSSIFGRISIGINTRDPAVIQSLLDLVDPVLVCFELPPMGYEDTPPTQAVWTVATPPAADAMSVRLLVDDPDGGCGHDPVGRTLPPEITYTDTEVQIVVRLTLLPWGSYTCEGWDPIPYVVELAGPVSGRILTGGANG